MTSFPKQQATRFVRPLHSGDRGPAASGGVELPPGVWANRATREVAIFADSYEITISLLVFEELDYIPLDWLEEETEDTFDRFIRSSPG